MPLGVGSSMMKIKVKAEWNGKATVDLVKKTLKKALYEEAEDTLTDSNKDVPLDESDLQGSGDTDIEVNSKGATASVFYDTAYAVKMHEHPEYDFQNGRKGKYLEDVIVARAQAAQERLKKALQTIFK